MKLTVTLERDETGMRVAECPSIPGGIVQVPTANRSRPLGSARPTVQSGP